jgi:hypothetical protein
VAYGQRDELRTQQILATLSPRDSSQAPDLIRTCGCLRIETRKILALELIEWQRIAAPATYSW